jgi:hypothetical protein
MILADRMAIRGRRVTARGLGPEFKRLLATSRGIRKLACYLVLAVAIFGVLSALRSKTPLGAAARGRTGLPRRNSLTSSVSRSSGLRGPPKRAVDEAVKLLEGEPTGVVSLIFGKEQDVLVDQH